MRLHRKAFTHRKLLHMRSFYTEKLFTHRSFLHTARFYTEKLLHTANLCTEKLLHGEASLRGREAFTQRSLKALETDAFTHGSFYTEKLLHTEAFTHRTFYLLVCAKHFPALLCTAKLAQHTSQHYFVLQNTKLPTKHFPVLLCTTKLA